jgi:predicted porin
MKKTLVALATLAVAGGAFAQSGMARDITGSGVTIFGVADATITQYKADGAGTANRLQGEGRNESTRLGFRGIEDIGGGWGAAFWLEAGYNQDNGTGSTSTLNNTSVGQNAINNSTANASATGGAAPTILSLGGAQGLTFNRAANVSLLNKDIGEIRLGRDYNPTFWNLTYFDPFGTVGAGAYTNIALGRLNVQNQVSPPGVPMPQVRTSNSVAWLSKDMNGFRLQYQYAFSEQLSTCTDLLTGSGVSTNTCYAASGAGANSAIRLTYASGPLSAGAAWSKTSYQSASSNPAAIIAAPGSTVGLNAYTGDYTAVNFGASYDFGIAKGFLQYGQNTYGAQSFGSNDYVPASATAVAGTQTNASKVGTINVGEVNVKHTLVGATIPQGAMTWKVSYATAQRSGGAATSTASGTYTAPTAPASQDGARQTQIALGGVYDLSKRTAVYSTWSKLTASGTGATAGMGITSATISSATGDQSAQTFDLGVRHRF